MNKIEFQQKLEEGNALIEQGKYEEAVELFDLLNLDSVRDPRLLQNIAKAYEKCHRFEDAEDLLLQARECAPKSRGAVFHLCTLAIKAGNLNDAMKYYNDFCAIAKYDSERFILQYRIAKAEKKSDAELIDILEKFKGEEPDDRWMYELAKLYAANGRVQEALELCDEITLWFYNGKYVKLAKEFRSYLTGEPIPEEEPIEEEESTVVRISGGSETKPETLDDADDEAEVESGSEAEAEPETPEVVTITGMDSEQAPIAEIETETAPEAAPETEPEIETETEPEIETETEPEIETETEPETAAERETETAPEETAENETETEPGHIPGTRFDEPVLPLDRIVAPQPESIVFPNQQVFVMDVRTGKLAVDAAVATENEFREQLRRKAELEETEQKLKNNRSELKKMNADLEYARAESEKLKSEAGGLRATLLALEQAVAEATVRKDSTEQAVKAAEQRIRELEAEEESRREAMAKEEAERAARMEAERKEREEAELRAKEEAERREREALERAAREEAERKEREEAEQKAAEEAERKAAEEAAEAARAAFVVTLNETAEEPPAEAPETESELKEMPNAPEEAPFKAASAESPFNGLSEEDEWARFEIRGTNEEEKKEENESEIRFTLGDAANESETAPEETVTIDVPAAEAEAVETAIEIQSEPEEAPETEMKIETESETETAPDIEAEAETETAPETDTETEQEETVENEPEPASEKPISELSEFEVFRMIQEKISERLDHIQVDPVSLTDLRHIMVYGTDEEPALNSARMLLKRIDEETHAGLGKVVKIHASKLRGIPIRETIDQLIGRKIIVESASLLSDRQLEDFASILRGRKKELMVCFADTLENLVQISDRVPEIPGSFSAVFNGNAPDVKELVNIVKSDLDRKDAMLTPEAEAEVRDYVRKFLTESPFDARAGVKAFTKDALHAAEHSGMFGLFTGKIDDNGFLHVALKHVKKAEG